MVRKTLLLLMLICCLSPVFADQAAYVSKAKALEAVEVINKTKILKKFCAPCGDTSAFVVAVSDSKASYTNFSDYWEVKVNNRGIDLAYTYVSVNGKWRNLAMILKLPVMEVPEFIP